MKLHDLNNLQKVPGYVPILKAVLKAQIQMLVDELHKQTGEESLVLTASTIEGTLCHLGSNTGQGFLQGRDDITSQFLAHCFKENNPSNEKQATQYPLYYRNFDSHTVDNSPTRQQKRKLQTSPVHPVSLTKVQPISTDIDNPEIRAKIPCLNHDVLDANKDSLTVTAIPVTDYNDLITIQADMIDVGKCIGNADAHKLPVGLIEIRDKSKKTLSSKIEEITERMKKDETHKLQCDDSSNSMEATQEDTRLEQKDEGVNGSCGTVSKDEEASGKTPNRQSDLNGAKLKDVSRASHRKPKLPRFNIGEASDDEDNDPTANYKAKGTSADVSNGIMHVASDISNNTNASQFANSATSRLTNSSVSQLYNGYVSLLTNSSVSELTNSSASQLNNRTVNQQNNGAVNQSNNGAVSQLTDTSVSQFSSNTVTLPACDTTILAADSVILEEHMLDISINIGDSDSNTAFAPISLDEIVDGVLLRENVTDIPLVGYYTGEETAKSLIENAFSSEKSYRNKSSKCARTAESVIVSGSSSEKNWVKCGMCPEKFPNEESFKFHVQNVVHTPKKFHCDFCGRKFCQLRDMERHRRIHTGERPFTCDVCQKTFARKDNLKSHKLKHFKV